MYCGHFIAYYRVRYRFSYSVKDGKGVAVIQRVVLYLSIVGLGGVLGANAYNSVVDAPSWGASIPESLETARKYFESTNPGTFFRVASPLAQIFTLIALVVCWKAGAWIRVLIGIALVLTVCADLLTFLYFYPRNEIMLVQPIDVAAATQAWQEWSWMNHVRSGLVFAALVCQLAALSRFERKN
jgi:hypothetical protein